MIEPLKLVPDGALGWESLTDELAERIGSRKLVVLTGAGISTESGIPDYRGEETARRARNPIRFADFIGNEEGRKRYWARSTLGWPRFLAARPNDAHFALKTLEESGQVLGLVTQNVDRLHERADSKNVVELHGALAEVECLACRRIELRSALHERLLAANPSFADEQVEIAPDGDAELPLAKVASFEVLGCEACGGTLKPRVVFFGETVRPEVVARAMSLLEEAEALLVVGSSLAVFSGFRFPRRARELGKDVFLVNVGETRADPLATLKVHGVAGPVLSRLAAGLGA